MSNSVRPHRRWPTRLPCPWDSPGKNTGVGCHFLLQCMKGKSESEVSQSCPTLRDPMVCTLPGSSVHGIFQARVLEWGAIAFSILVLWDKSITSHWLPFQALRLKPRLGINYLDKHWQHSQLRNVFQQNKMFTNFWSLYLKYCKPNCYPQKISQKKLCFIVLQIILASSHTKIQFDSIYSIRSIKKVTQHRKHYCKA